MKSKKVVDIYHILVYNGYLRLLDVCFQMYPFVSKAVFEIPCYLNYAQKFYLFDKLYGLHVH